MWKRRLVNPRFWFVMVVAALLVSLMAWLSWYVTIWPVMFGAFALAVTVPFVVKERDELRVLALVGGVLGVGIAIGGGIFLSYMIGSALPERMRSEPTEVNPLVSLRSVDGLRGDLYGAIFIRSGHIGSQRYFYWFEKSGDAITPRQKAVGVGTYLYEQDRNDAVLHIFDWELDGRAWRLIGRHDGGRTWRFYVPKGTVQTEMSVR